MSDLDQTYNNDNLVLISGESGTGKSASLINLPNPEGVLYLNCEAGKKLPFADKFNKHVITDPFQIFEAFDAVEGDEPLVKGIHTIVIDTLTYLMDMFESKHVLTASNTMKAWSEYNQYFKKLMQHYVAKSTKDVIFLAHTRTDIDENADKYTAVPVKGALKNNGVESYFSLVVSTKKVTLTELENYENEMLEITPDDEMLGFKHCFQTRLTKKTVGERIRAPMGMFTVQETFIDNDVKKLFERIHKYYN